MSQQMLLPPVKSKQLTELLRSRIDRYDGLQGSKRSLKLVKEIHRRFCKLYLYSLSEHADSPDLVIKVPVGSSDEAYQQRMYDESFCDRPRLFRRADPNAKPGYEYAAVRRIERHFRADKSLRFGVVRVYDLFPDEQAMVMQWVDQPNLRSMLYRTHRLGKRGQAVCLERVFQNMGAWLRRHHELPALDHCEVRNESREEYVESVEMFVAYLTDSSNRSSGDLQLFNRIVELAECHLPDAVKCGQVHGDFAPRNAFIDSDLRVSVFDTLGRFKAPIYEDIAKMLMTVKACGPQLMSGGMLYDVERLRQYESRFLHSYFFDQPIPYSIIRLFEAQLILEQWTATVYRHRDSRGVRRVVKGVRRTLWESGFRAYLRDIVDDIASNNNGQQVREDFGK